MGFWDKLGDVALNAMEKGVKKGTEFVKNTQSLTEEFESYSEAQLVNIYLQAKSKGKFSEQSVARTVLSRKYGYDKARFDFLNL